MLCWGRGTKFQDMGGGVLRGVRGHKFQGLGGALLGEGID